MTYDTDAINNIKFTQGFRGYDTAEVDEFLDDMIREIEKLNNTIKNLKEDVSKEKRKNQLNQQEIERLTEMNESLSAAAKEAPPVVETPVAPVAEPQPVQFKKITSLEDIKDTPEYKQMTQTLSDTLIDARQTAAKIVKNAEKHAQEVVEAGERKAQDRVAALNVEISENQRKLDSINSIVRNAKQRFKRDFQDQIAALESIQIIGDSDDEKIEVDKYVPVEKEAEPVHATEEFIKPDISSLESAVEDMLEEKQETEQKAEETGDTGVSTFDFSAIKKSMAKNQVSDRVEMKTTDTPKKPAVDTVSSSSNTSSNPSEDDENQQYIEIALSAYNDNKHHNTDYPNTSSNIRINEDDDEGGIYQPENRSVLSSVIEEILNNKRNDD